MKHQQMLVCCLALLGGFVLAACGGSGGISSPQAARNNDGAQPATSAETAAVPTNTKLVAAPAPTRIPAAATPLRPMAVRRAFPKLSFSRLTNLAQPDDGKNRLFITEQRGKVLVFPDQQDVASATVFLDLTDRVSVRANEEGLLGLAFDPAFRENGYFYLYYSASGPRRSVLSRFSTSQDNLDLADAGSELIIMEIPQPAGNHNGGQLVFGPDGYLYLGLGDGGRGGDPFGNGQDKGTLLGSILRIDVAGASGQERYRIPPDNPFVGVPGAREEIWAYGLRNPWRFSFDSETGRMWAADVGQNHWEEIDLIQGGRNYGWNVMEGGHCFSPPDGCDRTGLEHPVAEYTRDSGCSVTGGYVYRGRDLPSLTGAYVYGDFCSGKIWALRHDGQEVSEHLLIARSGLNITSFGVDLARSLYILSRNSGIYRLVPLE